MRFSYLLDEEIAGRLGLGKFITTDDFKALNIGFALDEGIASPNNVYRVFYGERSIWQIHFKISGNCGHGSLLHKNTPGEKLNYILGKMMELRSQEIKKLENNPELNVGDVTTINLTKISGGVHSNVVPPFMVVVFDMRLAVEVNHEAFEKQIKQWCIEAGGEIELEYEYKEPNVAPTKMDQTNPFWLEMEKSFNEHGLIFKKEVFPGGTDSQYLREVEIPAIGFSPMINTPILLHDHDEFLSAETYLDGIQIYKTIISKVANT